jgi:protein-S-isoprenylcysteine O-methyltransferase Ste14
MTLFLTSGRLDWVMGWVFFGVFLTFQALTALVLVPKNPDLLAERSTLQPGSKTWDVVLASFAVSWLPVAKWVVAGLDRRRGWSPGLPLVLQFAALVVMLLGYHGLNVWAMASNAFFAATVRIQEERGHAVVSSGPYRYVRHPGYLGAIAFQLASPILLGSLWAAIPAGLSALLLILRTALEDRTLINELDGYREYAGQVRYRLLPGVW